MSGADGGGTLARVLSGRQIQFIALGGAIGASLFVGSAPSIRAAGPGLLVAYLLAGVAVFLTARALGELLLADLSAPTFTMHIDRLLGRWAGFVSGWSYWLIWVLAGTFELAAIGQLIGYWWPGLPPGLAALVVLAALYGLNRLSVGLFGSLEMGLTLIKVATILLLIVGGGTMAVLHLGPAGQEAALGKPFADGLLPTGLAGLCAVLPFSVFAFGGTELVGITAAEAEEPERSLPRAVNGVLARFSIFYICALAVIMMVIGWRDIAPDRSPFVIVFERAGFPAAAGIVNAVVLSAVISSLNSGLFATARMLFTLGRLGDAPAAFARLDRRVVPVRGLQASALVLLAGVAMDFLAPAWILEFAGSSIAALLLLTWTLIVCAHARHRHLTAREKRSAFPMPFYPASSLFLLLFFAGVLTIMLFDPRFRPTILSFGAWMVAISLAFLIRARRAGGGATAMLANDA